MSTIATVVRAELVAGETPSCRICRRSQWHAMRDELRCTESRSPAPNGVCASRTVINLIGERNYERRCQELAHRCKFYQEEQ